jgi:dethiobiotin synthetase
MIPRVIVTGTDTGVGKTVFAAALAGALDAVYWKPVQAGLQEETDSETVLRLSGLAAERILPEAYRLKTPASPHLAAELDGIAIDPAALALPDTVRPLVVEAAGGLLVPLAREVVYIDVIAQWRAPVVLCARTTLGTINHSLLSTEACALAG